MLVVGGAMVASQTVVQTSTARSGRRLLEEHEFNALYARTARPLAAYIRRMIGGDGSSEDLLQESYLRLLRAPLPAMDERALNAYLYKTASRLIRDRWRRAQVDRRWRETLPPVLSSSSADAAEALDVDRILARMRGRDRAIVWLACVEGRSHAEIADILGLKAASIRVLLFRARRKLAGLLKDAGLGPEVTT